MDDLHHLDKRASALARDAALSPPDDLLTTDELATWLGVASITLKLWRMRGTGPKFIHVSLRNVRYRRSTVVAWLKKRECSSTQEFAHEGRRGRSGGRPKTAPKPDARQADARARG